MFERMAELYESGSIPWDSELPPPEVIDIVDQLAAGRALDLGCGYGRASIYLAKRGWQVDAVDFVPQAIKEAAVRANDAGLATQIQFHTGSVADLGFLDNAYDLALDVGCVHALDELEMQTYRDGLCRLLRPGAVYLLFARLQTSGEEQGSGPRGIPETAIGALFKDGFDLERVEYGQTDVEDHPAWASAWFWFRRRAD